MEDGSLIKWIHIISSTILFGTGIGSAFYMFCANSTKDIRFIYFATKYVVMADFIFTTPAVIVQLVTGLWLANILGYGLEDTWLVLAFILYCLVGIFWLPVVWMQIKMRDMAKEALEKNTNLPEQFWKMDKWWITLGSLAFPTMIVIFYLMVIREI